MGCTGIVQWLAGCYTKKKTEQHHREFHQMNTMLYCDKFEMKWFYYAITMAREAAACRASITLKMRKVHQRSLWAAAARHGNAADSIELRPLLP